MAEKRLSLSHFVCVGHEAKTKNTVCPGASPGMALGFPQEELPLPFLPVPLVALAPSFWMGAHGDGVGIKGQRTVSRHKTARPGPGDRTLLAGRAVLLSHGGAWPGRMGPLSEQGLPSSLQEPWDSPSRSHAAMADSRPAVEHHLPGGT